MRIGYPGLNRSLTCTPGSTFRLASFSETRFIGTVEKNLACLDEILRYNRARGILFFRITSTLIPFASHPVMRVDWQSRFGTELAALGKYVTAAGMRISMHPDQFVLINAKDPGIVERSVRELAYHADVLDLMGLGADAKIQIHVGGVYGEKQESMGRFIAEYRRLPAAVGRRLVIENDDRNYTARDCLAVHGETGIPVLFDNFHHILNNAGESVGDAFRSCAATWQAHDGPPMADYSSQKPGARRGAHAETLDTADFTRFIAETKPADFDIMLEIKDKETSALKALVSLRNIPFAAPLP